MNENSNFYKQYVKDLISNLKHDLNYPESKRGSMFTRTNMVNTKEIKAKIKELERKLK